jgi:hypothetical protein
MMWGSISSFDVFSGFFQDLKDYPHIWDYLLHNSGRFSRIFSERCLAFFWCDSSLVIPVCVIQISDLLETSFPGSHLLWMSGDESLREPSFSAFYYYYYSLKLYLHTESISQNVLFHGAVHIKNIYIILLQLQLQITITITTKNHNTKAGYWRASFLWQVFYVTSFICSSVRATLTIFSMTEVHLFKS